jgi:hypothetical protein
MVGGPRYWILSRDGGANIESYHKVMPFRQNQKFCSVCRFYVWQQYSINECGHVSDLEKALTNTWLLEEVRLVVRKGYMIPEIFDKNQFTYLPRQVYPVNSANLYIAYLDATLNPHGYIILDFDQNMHELLRFRTNIFTHEFPPITYVRLLVETHKSKYHAPLALRKANPKFWKAIIFNCDSDPLKAVSECSLNVVSVIFR